MSDFMLTGTDSGSRFDPPFLLRHADVQNLISSIGLRSTLLNRRAKRLHLLTGTEIIDCGGGVRLAGELTQHPTPKGLVILFHGWEGSSQSAYVVSAALALFNAGYSVFRLNFRDHGESHHLNKGLFNSTLLEEVLGAVGAIQSKWPHEHNCLAGYSLGGNFALRVAIAAPDYGITLNRVAAICPVIDPARSLLALEEARFFYHHYFVKKWRSSLLKKLRHFPEYDYGQELRRLTSLRALHDFFVPRFTDYAHRDDYFRAYAVTEKQLARLTMPTTIINSKDDPITRHDHLPSHTASSKLQIQLTDRGSHCAFLSDFRFNSWIDDRLTELFD